MGHKTKFYRECLKRAGRNSIDQANAVAALLGGLILLFILQNVGLREVANMEVPTTAVGSLAFTLAAAVLSVALAWIVIFLCRLALSPAEIYAQQQAKIKDLEAKLSNKIDRKRISELLAVQLSEGRALMAKCTYSEDLGRPTDEEVGLWLSNTKNIIEKELGSVKFTIYNTPGMPPPEYHLQDAALNRTWNGLRFRVVNLKTIVEELNKP